MGSVIREMFDREERQRENRHKEGHCRVCGLELEESYANTEDENGIPVLPILCADCAFYYCEVCYAEKEQILDEGELYGFCARCDIQENGCGSIGC